MGLKLRYEMSTTLADIKGNMPTVVLMIWVYLIVTIAAIREKL